MSITQAVRYPFDEPGWGPKLLMAALLTFAMIVFMPFLFLGLVPGAILLGYSLDIVNNIRDGKKPALPVWRDYGRYLARGAGMLPAMFVYNLPLVLMGCCLWLLRASIGDSLVQGVATLSVLCCLLPLSLLYVAVSWPMLAVGVAKYARDGKSGVFFEFSRLYDAITAIGSHTLQWFLATLIVNIGLLVINFTPPVIGTLLFCMLAFPVHAHLLGQYARLVDRYDPHKKRR